MAKRLGKTSGWAQLSLFGLFDRKSERIEAEPADLNGGADHGTKPENSPSREPGDVGKEVNYEDREQIRRDAQGLPREEAFEDVRGAFEQRGVERLPRQDRPAGEGADGNDHRPEQGRDREDRGPGEAPGAPRPDRIDGRGDRSPRHRVRAAVVTTSDP